MVHTYGFHEIRFRELRNKNSGGFARNTRVLRSRRCVLPVQFLRAMDGCMDILSACTASYASNTHTTHTCTLILVWWMWGEVVWKMVGRECADTQTAGGYLCLAAGVNPARRAACCWETVSGAWRRAASSCHCHGLLRRRAASTQEVPTRRAASCRKWRLETVRRAASNRGSEAILVRRAASYQDISGRRAASSCGWGADLGRRAASSQDISGRRAASCRVCGQGGGAGPWIVSFCR